MATVNLGVIKPVFKGAYNNSTAYVLDNIVTSGGSSYICILASTGNAVSNGTYWSSLATGGTDVGTTITTAGDLLYRDGSGLQRLAKGTASQALVMNSGATVPEWGSGGGLLQIKRYHYTGNQGINSTTFTNTNVAVAITPTQSDSHFWIHASINAGMDNHDSNAAFTIHDSALGSGYNTANQWCFPIHPDTDGSVNMGYMTGHHSYGADGNPDDYANKQSIIFGTYNPASNSSSARTFTVVCRTHRDSSTNGININGHSSGTGGHANRATSVIEVWEIANGIYS